MDVLMDKLAFTIDKKLKSDALKRKMTNIISFSELDRLNLSYQQSERRIHIHTTSRGEQIYIQFPGKEAARKGDKSRPWDFRPKIMTSDGEWINDVSFKDIWNDLIYISESGADVLPILASVLTRMAYMVDHQPVTETYSTGIVHFEPSSYDECDSTPIHWFKYFPDMSCIEYLQSTIGNIRGISIEAYLIMNDLLAQNEDCKYYYRDNELKKEKWDGNIGRKNNLLTHVAIIGFLERKIKFTEIMDQFQRMRGVAPIQEKRIPDITEGIVSYLK